LLVRFADLAGYFLLLPELWQIQIVVVPQLFSLILPHSIDVPVDCLRVLLLLLG